MSASRRGLLRGIGVGGLALPVLAACGSDDRSSGSGAGDQDGDQEGDQGGTTVSAADVPVGGGTILADEKIVVTQPREGEFQAFTAVCTHQACVVQSVAEGRINCPCHGSAFSVEDGSVVTGPAQTPLGSVPVSVDGDQVTVG